MTGAVVEVNSSGVEGPANNPNIKFRSFLCSGLNHGLLHEWNDNDSTLSPWMVCVTDYTCHMIIIAANYNIKHWLPMLNNIVVSPEELSAPRSSSEP
jgi:hypothetical protein